MKSIFKLAVFCAMLTLASCGSYKKIPYIQNYEFTNSLNERTPLYDAKIMPKDILTITVNTSDPSASAHFNLGRSVSYDNKGSNQGSLETYLVDNDGTIDFPILGRLQVLGLTKNQCEDLIKERLKLHLKEVPVVMVRMPNFRITVLGQVKSPGQYTINNEKVNILEAIALAGDLDIFGERKILLIREDGRGKRHVHTLDLTDATIMYNPLYYLQQNDIIYVKPNKTYVRNNQVRNSTSLWLTGLTTLVSISSLVINIIRWSR